MTSRMLKKNPSKKSLTLGTETVRALAQPRLAAIAAGIGGVGITYAKSVITCCMPPE